MALAPLRRTGLGDTLLPTMTGWATPVPGITFGNDGKTPLYVFPAWNATTHQYDPALQVPAGSNTVTMSDLQAGYYGTAAQAWAQQQTGIGGYNNDPTSATFNPDPSIEGYSVAYWVMQGAPVATAQTYAQRWASKAGRSVLKISDLGAIGPGDPLYQKLQAQNALNLAVIAPEAPTAGGNTVDTTYTTAPGAKLPVNAPSVPPATGPTTQVVTAPPTDTGFTATGTPTIASVAQSTTTTPETAGFGGLAALVLGGGLLLALTRKKKR